MCSCWYHGNHESIAMWDRERYSKHNSGIAIKTTMQRLDDSFTREEGIDVHIGKIKYINHEDLNALQISLMCTRYIPRFSIKEKHLNLKKKCVQS